MGGVREGRRKGEEGWDRKEGEKEKGSFAPTVFKSRRL